MDKIINIIYSIYFNFRYLPFKQAKFLPIYITTNLCVEKLQRGQLYVMCPCKYKQIIIGSGKSPSIQYFKSRIFISEGGKLIFNGKTKISQGTVLRCDKDSSITFGKNFYCNANCYMRSTCIISIGDNCSLGWGCILNTSDGHTVWHDNQKMDKEGDIIIGNKVWLASNCKVGKNTHIASECVVAQGAVVSKKFYDEYCLIGGIPAKVIKRNIKWEQ